MALICPVLLHGMYDLIATVERSPFSWAFLGFILILFAAAFVMVRRLSKQDRYI